MSELYGYCPNVQAIAICSISGLDDQKRSFENKVLNIQKMKKKKSMERNNLAMAPAKRKRNYVLKISKNSWKLLETLLTVNRFTGSV